MIFQHDNYVFGVPVGFCCETHSVNFDKPIELQITLKEHFS